jgi:hypothetical protein
MAHDVFISYSSKDKPIADAICAHLEGAGVRCWIAPRDIAPGDDWPAAISKAIAHSRVMVLVFSASSNSSEDVSRELFLAANSKLVIIPFKIENIEPEPGKQYYLARTHWLDAINPPTQEQIRALINCVKALIPVRETPPIVEFEPSIPPRVEQPVTVSEPPKQQPTRKKRVPWVHFLWIPVTLILLSLASWFVFNLLTHPATAVPKATPTTAATLTRTPIPVFTAKVGLTGVDLYNGPGDNYSKIDFVFTDYVTIIGQAYNCAWFKVTAKSSSGSEDGWVNADRVTYTAKCSDIPLAEFASAPIFTPTSTAIVFGDDFSDTRFDGTFNSGQWSLYGVAYTTIKQVDGALLFTKSSTNGPENGKLITTLSWSPKQFSYIEARIKVNQQHKGNMGNINIWLEKDSWYVGCGFLVGTTQPVFFCNQDEAPFTSADYYQESSSYAAYDRWYTVRIEIDPKTFELTFYLDGKYFGHWRPANADQLLNDKFNIVIGLWTDNGTAMSGSMDDVKVVK